VTVDVARPTRSRTAREGAPGRGHLAQTAACTRAKHFGGEHGRPADWCRQAGSGVVLTRGSASPLWASARRYGCPQLSTALPQNVSLSLATRPSVHHMLKDSCKSPTRSPAHGASRVPLPTDRMSIFNAKLAVSCVSPISGEICIYGGSRPSYTYRASISCPILIIT
jgi:hypothetical protein